MADTLEADRLSLRERRREDRRAWAAVHLHSARSMIDRLVVRVEPGWIELDQGVVRLLSKVQVDGFVFVQDETRLNIRRSSMLRIFKVWNRLPDPKRIRIRTVEVYGKSFFEYLEFYWRGGTGRLRLTSAFASKGKRSRAGDMREYRSLLVVLSDLGSGSVIRTCIAPNELSGR